MININRLTYLSELVSRADNANQPGAPDMTPADTSRIHTVVGWIAEANFVANVLAMRDNIDYRRPAPVWTVEKIKDTNVDWFNFLDRSAT